MSTSGKKPARDMGAVKRYAGWRDRTGPVLTLGERIPSKAGGKTANAKAVKVKGT